MAAIARTRATLRIFGDDLDPRAVTRLLGAEPTAAARKGEALAGGARPAASGRTIVARSGSWRLTAGEAVPGDLNAQIGAVMAAVTDDLAVWRELTRRYRCDVFCGLFLGGVDGGEDLEPAVLAALGVRGLRLGLDIYAVDD